MTIEPMTQGATIVGWRVTCDSKMVGGGPCTFKVDVGLGIPVTIAHLEEELAYQGWAIAHGDPEASRYHCPNHVASATSTYIADEGHELCAVCRGSGQHPMATARQKSPCAICLGTGQIPARSVEDALIVTHGASPIWPPAEPGFAKVYAAAPFPRCPQCDSIGETGCPNPYHDQDRRAAYARSEPERRIVGFEVSDRFTEPQEGLVTQIFRRSELPWDARIIDAAYSRIVRNLDSEEPSLRERFIIVAAYPLCAYSAWRIRRVVTWRSE